MRTTVTLDGDVERLLRDEMHRSRRPFKVCLNEAVRAGLRARPARARRFVVRPLRLGQLLPGIDPAKLNSLADELEDQALLERMRSAEAAARRSPGRRR
jgi:hypothetical protein